jgi:hypothetical protein
MNKEQQELLDEVYENYLNNFIEPICPPNLDVQPDYYKPMTKEWFIKSTKENNSRGQEFSETWGLKIEERELSLVERSELGYKYVEYNKWDALLGGGKESDEELCDDYNIPTKLITITYNDKTIESYE